MTQRDNAGEWARQMKFSVGEEVVLTDEYEKEFGGNLPAGTRGKVASLPKDDRYVNVLINERSSQWWKGFWRKWMGDSIEELRKEFIVEGTESQ